MSRRILASRASRSGSRHIFHKDPCCQFPSLSESLRLIPYVNQSLDTPRESFSEKVGNPQPLKLGSKVKTIVVVVVVVVVVECWCFWWWCWSC